MNKYKIQYLQSTDYITLQTKKFANIILNNFNEYKVQQRTISFVQTKMTQILLTMYTSLINNEKVN
jgi:hypothetical protein